MTILKPWERYVAIDIIFQLTLTYPRHSPRALWPSRTTKHFTLSRNPVSLFCFRLSSFSFLSHPPSFFVVSSCRMPLLSSTGSIVSRSFFLYISWHVTNSPALVHCVRWSLKMRFVSNPELRLPSAKSVVVRTPTVRSGFQSAHLVAWHCLSRLSHPNGRQHSRHLLQRYCHFSCLQHCVGSSHEPGAKIIFSLYSNLLPPWLFSVRTGSRAVSPTSTTAPPSLHRPLLQHRSVASLCPHALLLAVVTNYLLPFLFTQPIPPQHVQHCTAAQLTLFISIKILRQ